MLYHAIQYRCSPRALLHKKKKASAAEMGGRKEVLFKRDDNLSAYLPRLLNVFPGVGVPPAHHDRRGGGGGAARVTLALPFVDG